MSKVGTKATFQRIWSAKEAVSKALSKFQLKRGADLQGVCCFPFQAIGQGLAFGLERMEARNRKIPPVTKSTSNSLRCSYPECFKRTWAIWF